MKTGSPKSLWDHSIEPKARIILHTALDMYGLVGQVPQTLMTGQTEDISNLCEFEWFPWVMLFRSTAGYPDDKIFIYHWLGPAIDVSTVRTWSQICCSPFVFWGN